MVAYVHTSTKRNGHGHVRCNLVLNHDWYTWLLFPWAHTHNKKTSASLKPKAALFILKILDFVLAGDKSGAHAGDFYSLTVIVFLPPCRSEKRHVRYFTALPICIICSYVGKFCFKIVNTTSLQALHFYEGGNEKDKCYSCS